MIKSIGDKNDPRLYLFLTFISMAVSLFLHPEIGILSFFTVSMLWLFMAGWGGRVPVYILFYVVFYGLTQLALSWIKLSPSSAFAVTISVTGTGARKMLVPVLFAMMLANMPTGSLLGALYAMRVPKPFGIGLAIMLRFFPTIGQEYRAVRNAQKFRGIGIGFWGILFHLPRAIEFVLIPLVIRITKISEELSASVTVRGVRFDNSVTSFRPVCFRAKDYILLILSSAIYLLILICDFTVFGGTL